MLSQEEADGFLDMPKVLEDEGTILFPPPGERLELRANSFDERHSFLFDVNRGRIKVTKCTYQERYSISEIVLRLDLDGPPHTNPDGEVIQCPHLHIYREGYGDRWATPIPPTFSKTDDLIVTLREFLSYCHAQNIPLIQRSVT